MALNDDVEVYTVSATQEVEVITVSAGTQGPQGDPGPGGPAGPANTLTVGTTTTGAAGSSAAVTITGTAPNQIVNFTIPRGNTGANGANNVITIGTVTTLASGASATATLTGTSPNQVLNLGIPQGPQGNAGAGSPDATTTSKGSVQLAGDLAGTAAAPTVPGLANKISTSGTRAIKVGPNAYDVSIPSGGPNSAFFVADKTNDTNDASILFRSAGSTKAEIGLPGDNDLHVKVVTGATESTLTFTDAMIISNSSGKVNVAQGLGVGTIPTEKFHVAANLTGARLLSKLENTATTGSGSAGFLMTGRGKSWYIITDVGMNGGDNLGIMSDTAGYPPVVMVTPSAVGIGTDTPAAKLHVAGSAQVDGTVTASATPTAVSHLTRKDYVDSAVSPKADKTITISAGTGLTGGGDLSTARTLAVAYGSAAGTAVQGNDARVTADQAAGTASIRTIGTGALQAAAGNHTHTASAISDSTTVGRSVLTAADATAARTAIGAGTSSLALGTTSTTAAAGDTVGRVAVLEGYNKVLVLSAAAAVPAGTPANTVIFRTAT